ITVTAVCPGLIDTGIISNARLSGMGKVDRAKKRLNRLYRLRGYTPEKAAERIADAIGHDPEIVPVTAEAHIGLALSRLSPAALRGYARMTLPGQGPRRPVPRQHLWPLPSITRRNPMSTEVPHTPAPLDDEPDKLVLHVRDVQFDWSRLDLHWIPNEPFATHVINVLHLLLPEGERWFVEVFKQAVPHITDDELRQPEPDFIGKEAVHAEAHAAVIDHMDAHVLKHRAYVEQIAWLFRLVLGERDLSGARVFAWL